MTKTQQSLLAHFTQHRFVFWHDTEGSFVDEVASFNAPGISVVQLDSTPALGIKLDIEQAAADSKWLFYSQQTEPAPEHDWLLDVRLRAKAFHADEASSQLEELGLQTISLRAHLKLRASFLKAKDRFERLKRWVLPTDSALDLDRKMIAVLLRADQPDLASILLKIFLGMDGDEVDLQREPKGWGDVASHGLLPVFWDLVRAEYGYAESDPSLRDLLFRMLVTDLAQGLAGKLPAQLAHFRIQDRAKAATISVFLAQWRTNIAHYASYDAISAAVSTELNLSVCIVGLRAEDLLDAMTFAAVERWIIIDLRDRILNGAAASIDIVRSIFERRRDGHWVNTKLVANSRESQALLCCYQALEAAGDFLTLCEQHAAGFSFDSGIGAVEQYQQTLFRFDQHYRHLHRAAEQVDMMGWQLLHKLRDRVEEAYTGWFLPQLALAWSKVLEGEHGLLKQWQLPGVVNQQDFYRREVKSLLDNTSAKRVFVIISDAFRFEAAEELCSQIQNRNKYKASLGMMLGVLPSYTSLGMAALLPHETLAYKEGSTLSVQIDGKPTSSLENRNAILAAHGGIAVNWEEFVALGKDKAREKVRDASVVYIYHDRIDLLGDKAPSERKTFEAVEQTLKELNDLLGFLTGNLNAATIFVTADHGFLYQESALDAADRSTLDIKDETKNAQLFTSKKRYVLGKNLAETDKAWCGSTAMTAGTEPSASMDFWVPKGATRFHFAGGARFVHGSAMPQEVVIPLLTVKLSESEKAKVSQVNIAPLLFSNKIVTNMSRVEFIQTEPVSAKILARSVTVSLQDGEATISNIQTVTFDSASASMDERKKSIILTLQSGNYDPKKDYYLVVRDVDSKVELHRMPMKIDLALANDF